MFTLHVFLVVLLAAQVVYSYRVFIKTAAEKRTKTAAIHGILILAAALVIAINIGLAVDSLRSP